ncbi:aminotransferase-like domain-containing protein [Massilia sp. S19_KUP03_FR1]|uniref:aminotransferase-like domain-containing protein n=1 Tax=Massilia sp. S19_KUP03_FR1 TaxID=3025503 RepID=UPI002FCDDE12
MIRYKEYADELAQRIQAGHLKPGDRLPSIRAVKRQRGVSASTVFSAYYLLETQGYVEARNRSGYYVSAKMPLPGLAERPTPVAQAHALPLDFSTLACQMLAQAGQRNLVPMGSAFPSPELFPFDQLAMSMGRALRRMDPWQTVEDLSPGNPALRRQIAMRYGTLGMDLAPAELVVTSGAMEALNLALEVTTQPGDLVAIESPAFYGALQALERRGLRAVEVQTHPRTGVELASLRRVLDTHAVKACWFMPTFQNPMGCTMPDEAKAALVGLLTTRQIPLIEDDVYGELYHGPRHPPPAKAWDREGWVLHCGSFSKSLAPGYRIGWVAAGRFTARLARHKMMSSLATALPSQLAILDFLQKRSFERHLRALRHALARQQAAAIRAIGQYFPSATKVTQPQGGYFVWVELPADIDALAVHQQAGQQGIGTAPGHLFSADHRYSHHLRINHGYPGDLRSEASFKVLGEIVHRNRARSGT